MLRFRSRHLAPVALVALLAAAASACGSRGPLDDTPYVDASADATTLPATPDAAPPVALDASVPDAVAPEAGPIERALECATCLGEECGAGVAECLANDGCRSGLLCAATQCLGGTAGTLPCLMECSKLAGDGSNLLLATLQCVFQTCGDTCSGVLPGGPQTPPPRPRRMLAEQALREAASFPSSRSTPSSP